MSRPRPLELLVVWCAAALFAAVLWWPLATVAAEAPGEDAVLAVPPAWLLPLDDAYIFIRYAQQAARGHPFQWNDGESSTGASSLLFALLQVPGQWLFHDLAGWSRWASFIGLSSLWALGIAGLRLLRLAEVAEPWPLAGALALVWSGPIGWVTIAGMDSAFGCAALLWATGSWIAACRSGAAVGLRAHAGLFVALGLLPFVRPDFAAITGLAAAGLALRLGPPVPRWSAVLVLLPGALLAGLHLAMTGHLSPGGMIAKSILSEPFLTLAGAADLYGIVLQRGLVPVYAGLEGRLLPPPVGWLAAAMAVATVVRAWRQRRSLQGRSLLPLAAVWWTLVAIAPVSGYFVWQYLRHHHPGLACAWLLAAATLAALASALRRRGLFAWFRHGPKLILALPCLLWLGFPQWSLDYFVATVNFYQQNGQAAEWLRDHGRGRVVLLHDAGLLALAHDGPAVDVMGLGTTDFALPYRHGPGSVVETLARRPRLPELAVVWDSLFEIPGLLEPPLMATPKRPDLPERNRLRISRLRSARLAATPLASPGLDLAYLPDERRLRWIQPLGGANLALTLAGEDGRPQLHGCRPLGGGLRLELPAGVERVRLRATAQEGLEGTLSAGVSAGAREIHLPRGSASWTVAEVSVAGADHLEVRNLGPGAPCLESIAFQD